MTPIAAPEPMDQPMPQPATKPTPTLWFEQDGAYFSYRDRPYYTLSLLAPEHEGIVCPSFWCEAPFSVRDMDMAGAKRAVAWFIAECNRAGFAAVRAPGFDDQPSFDAHPACEADDLARYRADQTDLDIGQFAEFRASAALRTDLDALIADTLAANAMVPMPAQLQQADAGGRAAVAALIALTVSGCDDRTVAIPSDKVVVGRTYYGPRNYADLWEDAETGCQYLGYGTSLGLTPRLGADGKPICRPPSIKAGTR